MKTVIFLLITVFITLKGVASDTLTYRQLFDSLEINVSILDVKTQLKKHLKETSDNYKKLGHLLDSLSLLKQTTILYDTTVIRYEEDKDDLITFETVLFELFKINKAEVLIQKKVIDKKEIIVLDRYIACCSQKMYKQNNKHICSKAWVFMVNNRIIGNLTSHQYWRIINCF